MANKPGNPKPDPLAAAPVKEQALSNLDKAYVHAFIAVFWDATATKGVAMQSQGEGWVDGQSVFDPFFPEWRKVERDYRVAVSKCSELMRALCEEGFAETTVADGRTYFRLKY